LSKSQKSMSKARRKNNGGRSADLLTGSSAPREVARTLEAGIGAEVRKLRKEHDLTVSQLGTAAGISAGMLSKIENGTISPSLATLDSLSKALNVSVSRLFAESDERRDCSFVKAGNGVRIERRGTKAGHLDRLVSSHTLSRCGAERHLTLIFDTRALSLSTCSAARFATGMLTRATFLNQGMPSSSTPPPGTALRNL
jgi:transcriptional regulator with XRE-family HTH domain